MAEEKIEELTGSSWAEKLKTALESWPLYRMLHYRGAQDSTELPENIWLFCAKCKNVQRWKRELVHRFGGSSIRIKQRTGWDDVEYTCSNCPPSNPSSVRYNFFWSQDEEPADAVDDEPAYAVGEFQKVGQWPPLEERVAGHAE